MIALIVAKAENGVIGRNNQMPWRIPAELQYFKLRTMGKPMIMGRKTFESLGRVLPGRPHIVISRDQRPLPDNCYLVHSWEAALSTAEELAEGGEVIVIGGAQVYQQALPLADTLYITEVHLRPDGDTYFPTINPQHWQEVEREEHPVDADSAIAYSIVTLQRIED